MMLFTANIYTDGSFYAQGIASGLFWAITIYMLLIMGHYALSNKKPHASKLFLLGALSAASYALFDCYSISVNYPETKDFLSETLLFFGKISMPIAVFFNFVMFSQAIPIKTLDSFVFWYKTKKYYSLFYILLLVLLIYLVNIDDSEIVLMLSLLVALLNNILCQIIANNALVSSSFKRIHQFVLLGVAVTTLVSVLAVKFDDIRVISHYFWVFLHFSFSIFMMFFYFIISRFIIESVPFENISRYNIDGFYKHVYHALNNNEFFIEYQPKINLKNKHICGMEALIRWEHHENGLIPPSEFIPMAERSEIIDHICKWVICQVINDIKQIRSYGINVPIAINFSVGNIHPTMVQFLIDCLKKYDVPSDAVIVEITETLFLDMNDEQKSSLHMLRDAHISLSMDDFGAGYSSLRHFVKMGLSEVKIDKDLTDTILDSRQNTVIESIITMCNALGIKVVAEGVNDIEISEALIDLRCQMAQGYGICRPKRLDAIMDWVKNYEYK